MSEQRCLVFFRADAVGLDDAGRRLASAGLRVDAAADHLSVRLGGGPVLRIRYARGPGVTAEARAIGAGSRHAAALATCDARFEVTFDDLAAVLDEVNTLLEVQMTLQEATRGVLYTAWNKALTSS